MESARAGLAPRAVRARAAFNAAETGGGSCFGSVTVGWDTDGDWGLLGLQSEQRTYRRIFARLRSSRLGVTRAQIRHLSAGHFPSLPGNNQ
jgi:hypothetical protein